MVRYRNSYYDQQQELLRIKYRNLRNNISSISSKLSDINASYDMLHNSIRSNIKLDGRMPNEDEFIKIHDEIRGVKSEVSGSLIPYINSKC